MENILGSKKEILTKEERTFFLEVLKRLSNPIKGQIFDTEENGSSHLDILIASLKEKNLVDLFEKFKKMTPKILLERQNETTLYINLANAMLEISKEE